MACALLGGCADVPTVDLRDWQLTIEGESGTHDVRLPGKLGHGIESHETVYHLRTHVVLPPAWRGHDVVFGIEFLRSSSRLSVDGHEVPSLDDHVLDSARQMTPHRYRIDARQTDREALDLDLAVHCLQSQGS